MASALVEVLLPVELGPARIPWARGTRAGSWVFASGVMATDSKGGAGAEMVDGPRPLSGQPRWYREASRMFRCAQEVLQAGATDFSRAVRTAQFCRAGRGA